MNGLIILGNKRDLKSEDLWGLEKREISDQLTKKFESNWSALTNKQFKKYVIIHFFKLEIFKNKNRYLENMNEQKNKSSAQVKYKVTEANGEDVKLVFIEF